VRIRSEIPLHFRIAQKLHDSPFELFPGAKKTIPHGKDERSMDSARPARQVIRIQRPLTLPLDDAPTGEVTFEGGVPLKPSYSIRSGENGFFSVANADALYRVMRVASAGELGLVLATVGLFGDDRFSPWFTNNTCYYTETDNSRQIFDFL